MSPDDADPKGLIREAYRIEGISAAECRSVFVDWALSLPAGAEIGPPIAVLVAAYGAQAPDHPMTRVLRDGAAPVPEPKRRGGRAGRLSAPVPPPDGPAR